MNRDIWRNVALMGAVSLLVIAVGWVLAGQAARYSVLVGVALAFGGQALAHVVLAGFLYPGHRVAVYAGGTLVRLGLVVLMLFAGEPWFGVQLLPAILAMLVVLFVTTLMEPVLSHSDQ